MLVAFKNLLQQIVISYPKVLIFSTYSFFDLNSDLNLLNRNVWYFCILQMILNDQSVQVSYNFFNRKIARYFKLPLSIILFCFIVVIKHSFLKKIRILGDKYDTKVIIVHFRTVCRSFTLLRYILRHLKANQQIISTYLMAFLALFLLLLLFLFLVLFNHFYPFRVF